MRTTFLVALGLATWTAACGDKKATDKNKPNSGDANPGTPDNPKSPSSPGFSVIQAKFGGVIDSSKADPVPIGGVTDRGVTDCTGKDAGTIFIDDQGSYQELYACVGAYGAADHPYFKDYSIQKAYEAKTLGIYAGFFTDKVDGVADFSMVLIFDQGDTLRPNCEYTHYSDKTLHSGYGGNTVTKANLDQMTSLQSGTGVCSGAKLVDFHDLTKVKLQDYSDRTEALTLTKIYP